MFRRINVDAFSGPPCTVKSAWRSPSRFNVRSITRPVTGSLKMPVETGSSFRSTNRGRPTFTETIRIEDYLSNQSHHMTVGILA